MTVQINPIEINIEAKELEQVQKYMDEVAKGFAEWCGNYFFFDGEKWSNYTERHTTSEMLQKYKDSLSLS